MLARSRAVLCVLCVLSVSWLASAALADDPFAKVTDDPKLPRVLLIGDSISIGYTVPVRAALAGKANVHRAPTNCGPTIVGIKEIDKWLGEKKWDVIHFNFGLHDLKQINGKQQVSLEDYEKNLRTIAEKMKLASAKILWCSTTPVPDGKLNPPRTFGDVAKYNDAAARVMKDLEIPTNDLYTFALARQQEIQNKNDVHFSAAGSKTLGEEVARQITALLP